MVLIETIELLSQLSEKHPLLLEVIQNLERLEKIEVHPLANDLFALMGQMEDFNRQYTITGKSIPRTFFEGTAQEEILFVPEGRIDVFSDKDDKSMDRWIKYNQNLKAFIGLRKTMLTECSGEQLEIINSKSEIKKLAEKVEQIPI